jgi:hypothetical protein
MNLDHARRAVVRALLILPSQRSPEDRLRLALAVLADRKLLCLLDKLRAAKQRAEEAREA